MLIDVPFSSCRMNNFPPLSFSLGTQGDAGKMNKCVTPGREWNSRSGEAPQQEYLSYDLCVECVHEAEEAML